MMLMRLLPVVLLAAPLYAGAAEPNARTVTEAYQDWLVVCTERTGNRQCRAQQELVNAKKQAVVLFTLAKPDKGNRVFQIALPHMLDLTKGVGIAVDGKKPRNYSYRFCNKAACFVQVEGNDPLFTQLNMGTDGSLKVTPMGAGEQKEVEFKFSLKGFSSAASQI